MRIVNKDAFNSHIDTIFAQLKLLKVDQILLLQPASFMSGFQNNSLPPFCENSVLFDKFTSLTPGPPIRIILHLELM